MPYMNISRNDPIENPNFFQISPDTFRDDAYRPFDVYYRTTDGTMVLYCALGDKLSRGFREKLHKEHIIDRLYIRSKDRANFDLYMESVLASFLDAEDLSLERKVQLAYDTIRTTAQSVFESPKADIIRRYKKTVLATMDFVFENDDSYRELLGRTTVDSGLYNHSINVGILSMGLVSALVKTGVEIDASEIVPGFFLHDIGKTLMPQEILFKSGPFSRLDWKIMQRHPESGCQLLRQCNSLTEDIKLIVAQHHERHNGTGYPFGLKGNQIHFNAKICAIADVFDGLTSLRPFRTEHSTYAALTIMKNEMAADFDPRLFAAFVSLFGT